MLTFHQKLTYNYQQEQLFVQKPTYILKNHKINEANGDNGDNVMVPRFSLKNPEIFKDFPSNTKKQFNDDLITLAIEYGMILEIEYTGEDDSAIKHTRTIYPMVFGKSKKNNKLLRAWHFKGWSISNGGKIEKEWRLFRADRIISITFTGAFYRLAPEGYNETSDKAMSVIYKQADLNEIRNNQTKLISSQQIDSISRVVLNKVKEVEVKDLKFTLNVENPWESNIIPKKDAKSIRITFAKPMSGNGLPIAIVGTSIGRNNIFKLKEGTNIIGTYKCIKWAMANSLEKLEKIDKYEQFKLYLFLKAI